MSGTHCRIMRKTDDDGRMVVVLEDLSSNGTYFNGEKVSKVIASIITSFKYVLISIVDRKRQLQRTEKRRRNTFTKRDRRISRFQ